MKLELTRKIKEVLQDPDARRQLQVALAEDGNTREIKVGSRRYELVPLSAADTRSTSTR